jgi:hypothetical protein
MPYDWGTPAFSVCLSLAAAYDGDAAYSGSSIMKNDPRGRSVRRRPVEASSSTSDMEGRQYIVEATLIDVWTSHVLDVRTDLSIAPVGMLWAFEEP